MLAASRLTHRNSPFPPAPTSTAIYQCRDHIIIFRVLQHTAGIAFTKHTIDFDPRASPRKRKTPDRQCHSRGRGTPFSQYLRLQKSMRNYQISSTISTDHVRCACVHVQPPHPHRYRYLDLSIPAAFPATGASIPASASPFHRLVVPGAVAFHQRRDTAAAVPIS